jgi:vesicular inhibitory amino acid transporter
MLAAMMRQDRHALTYADVLISAYGTWSRPVILALFVLELATFSVATVELFADSMASLYPAIAPFTFKLVSFLM